MCCCSATPRWLARTALAHTCGGQCRRPLRHLHLRRSTPQHSAVSPTSTLHLGPAPTCLSSCLHRPRRRWRAMAADVPTATHTSRLRGTRASPCASARASYVTTDSNAPPRSPSCTTSSVGECRHLYLAPTRGSAHHDSPRPVASSAAPRAWRRGFHSRCSAVARSRSTDAKRSLSCAPL